MNRKIPMVAAAASGGMLAAAFLPAVVAFADSGESSGPGDAAFTVDGLTLDPGSDGYDDISALFTNAPLLQMGGGALGDASLASQDFTAYDGTGEAAHEIGTVETGVNAANLFGIDSAQFTVTEVTPEIDPDAVESVLTDSGDVDFAEADFTAGDLADALTDGNLDFTGEVSAEDVTDALAGSDVSLDDSGVSASDIADAINGSDISETFDALPVDGTVYSITNLTSGLPFLDDFGLGIYNVYEAVPFEDEDGAASITDTLVTPLGNFDLPTDFDATAPLDPTDTFAGLDPASEPSLFGGLLDGLLDGSGGDSGSGGAGSVAAMAAEENDDSDGASDNAFTLGDFTYDPGEDGFDKIDPLFGDAPLLEIAVGKLELPFGGKTLPLGLAQQDLEVYDDTGDNLGSVKADVNPANILGIESTQLTVDYGEDDADVHPADGVDLDQLPADGTVMSVTDFGGGFMNVYEAVPDEDGTEGASISDTLVTPWGTVDLPTDFDAVANLDPGSAVDGLGTGAGGSLLDGLFDGPDGLLPMADGKGDGGDDSTGADSELPGSDHAFAIDDTTFDPGSDGWDSVTPLFGVAPLMEIGGATLDPSGLGVPLDEIELATQNLDIYEDDALVGAVGTAVNTSNIVGIDTTQFTVDSLHASDADIAGVLGDSGDISFDDDAPVSESDVAGALADNLDIGSGDISADDVIDALADTDFAEDLGISEDVFGDVTFDPDGVADGITFDPADVASALNDNLDTAAITADLPESGTVYSVTDLGFLGIHNVYEAIPSDGDAAPTITDTLVTPFGDFDLSTMFNALADLNPGDAAAGVDDSGGGLLGLFDDLLDGLFWGGSDDEGSGEIDDASASQIASALGDFDDADFSGDDSSLDDVADALADGDGTDILGDDVSGDDVSTALDEADISIDNDDVSASDLADALNDAGGSDVGGSDDAFGGLFDGLFDDIGNFFDDLFDVGGEDGGLGDIFSSIF